MCSTEMADKLRYTSWGKRVITITHPAFHHFCRILIPQGKIIDQSRWSAEIKTHKDLIFDKTSGECNFLYQSRTSQFASSPFVGSITSKKIITANPLTFIEGMNPFTLALARLIELNAITLSQQFLNEEEMSPLRFLLDSLINLYYPNGEEVLQVRQGGTTTHRTAGLKFKMNVSINITPNILNRVSMFPDTIAKTRGNPANYSINFWGFLSLGVGIGHLECQFNRIPYIPELFYITVIRDSYHDVENYCLFC